MFNLSEIPLLNVFSMSFLERCVESRSKSRSRTCEADKVWRNRDQLKEVDSGKLEIKSLRNRALRGLSIPTEEFSASIQRNACEIVYRSLRTVVVLKAVKPHHRYFDATEV